MLFLNRCFEEVGACPSVGSSSECFLSDPESGVLPMTSGVLPMTSGVTGQAGTQ